MHDPIRVQVLERTTQLFDQGLHLRGLKTRLHGPQQFLEFMLHIIHDHEDVTRGMTIFLRACCPVHEIPLVLSWCTRPRRKKLHTAYFSDYIC